MYVYNLCWNTLFTMNTSVPFFQMLASLSIYKSTSITMWGVNFHFLNGIYMWYFVVNVDTNITNYTICCQECAIYCVKFKLLMRQVVWHPFTKLTDVLSQNYLLVQSIKISQFCQLFFKNRKRCHSYEGKNTGWETAIIGPRGKYLGASEEGKCRMKKTA